MFILDPFNNCGAPRKCRSTPVSSITHVSVSKNKFIKFSLLIQCMLPACNEYGRICRQNFGIRQFDQPAKWVLLLLLCAMTACSEPETHVVKINLVNDLGIQAQLALCKDVLHCGSISDRWMPKQINAKAAETVIVSNEEMTVFKVTTKLNGKSDVRCLRVRIDRSSQADHNLLLSSATDC
jgi:hypothetical protein